MSAIRQDVATLGPGWNQVLTNYALAMQALDDLPITDSNSWKFLAAIHGFDRNLWIGVQVLAENEPVPQALEDDTYGNQCLHQSWYFLPWHRGYLSAFEAIVAAKVRELTGDDWALPYWNYLDDSNPDAPRVPDAFIAETLPDGITPNPLARYPRRPQFTSLQPNRFSLSLASMAETDFSVGSGALGFGDGAIDVFDQFPGMTGELESNPHNTVHVQVNGFMGDPRLAGLDPLFWLHHCNVDRLWEAWMNTPGNRMVRNPRWNSGPARRRMVMPDPGGGGQAFTCLDTLPGGKFYPAYDDLTRGTGAAPSVMLAAHVNMGPAERQRVEPIGASATVMTVGAAPQDVQLQLEPVFTAQGIAAMGANVVGQETVRLYLALEAVRSTAPAPLVDVYLNLPAGAAPEQHPELQAGQLAMFGVNIASNPAGGHGGNGSSFTIDITELVQQLSRGGGFDPRSCRVTLVPREQISDAEPITVDRISILKRSGIAS